MEIGRKSRKVEKGRKYLLLDVHEDLIILHLFLKTQKTVLIILYNVNYYLCLLL